MTQLTWKTEKRKVSELAEWAKNPHKPSKKDMQELESSLDELGNYEPLVVDTDNTVLAGNKRLRIAKKNKELEVEVSIPSRKLTDEERDKIGLMSNLHKGEWNNDMLVEQFDKELLKGLDFDVDYFEEVEEDNFEYKEDETETDIKRGDIIQLGTHRIMCGDSTVRADVERLMDDKRADMVFTDPPYGVEYRGGKAQEIRGGVIRESLEGDMEEGVYDEWVSLWKLFARKDTPFYIWAALEKGGNVYSAIKNNDFTIRSIIVWNKIKPCFAGYMAQYKQKHELCLYCHLDAPRWYGDTTEYTVWDIHQSRKNIYHPTQKPVELAGIAIKNSSRPNDIVLDLFLGSGSTLIACEQANRICYGMELSEKYCEVICQRWEKFTGKKRKML